MLNIQTRSYDHNKSCTCNTNVLTAPLRKGACWLKAKDAEQNAAAPKIMAQIEAAGFFHASSSAMDGKSSATGPGCTTLMGLAAWAGVKGEGFGCLASATLCDVRAFSLSSDAAGVTL